LCLFAEISAVGRGMVIKRQDSWRIPEKRRLILLFIKYYVRLIFESVKSESKKSENLQSFGNTKPIKIKYKKRKKNLSKKTKKLFHAFSGGEIQVIEHLA
jgi:hypothetical protein